MLSSLIKSEIYKMAAMHRRDGITNKDLPVIRVLEAELFNKCLSINADLIRVFHDTASSVQNLIHSRYLFFLTDNTGVVMDFQGSEEAIKDHYTCGLRPGMACCDKKMGINSIYLSLKYNRPFNFPPNEFYFEHFRNWCCYALPILIDTTVLGCFGISTLKGRIKGELIAIANLMGDRITDNYQKCTNVSQYTSEIKLSDKYLTILKKLSEGLKDEAIALELGLSVNTVKYHKKNIFKILNAASGVEAVAKAVRMKII